MVSPARPRTRCRSDFLSAGAEALRQRDRLRLLRFWHRCVLFSRNRRHRRIDLARCRPRQNRRSRRGLFLRPLSHPPALCDLAWTSDSTTTDLDLSLHLSNHGRSPQWVGIFLEKTTNALVNKLLPVRKTARS